MSHPIGRLLRCLAQGRARAIPYEEKVRSRGPLYVNPIHYGQDGNDVLRRHLESSTPLMVARLGGAELRCLAFFLKVRTTANRPYPAKVRAAMFNNAGFFPANTANLDRFSEMLLSDMQGADVMGVCFNRYEAEIYNSRCPGAALVEFGCLEPFRYQPPWSSSLRGKTVLVIHPFAESIARQYHDCRRLLFEDPEVLPEFELKTIRAVQSSGNSKVEFANWFDAYDHLCRQIRNVEFDIALIGAGAYGLPLAAFVKRLGKQAIQLGGVTQILFGIKGHRWETVYADSTAKLFNEHWIRPSEEERPEGFLRVEGGAYW